MSAAVAVSRALATGPDAPAAASGGDGREAREAAIARGAVAVEALAAAGEAMRGLLAAEAARVRLGAGAAMCI
jgi:hypothetical protein